MQDSLYKTYEFFRLFHSEPPASPGSNLMQVLNQHADTLQHHRLQHTNILNGSSSRNGEELASSEGLDAARAYVQHSGSSLTSLGLTHCSFTLHDLGMLLDRLWQGSSENTEGGRTEVPEYNRPGPDSSGAGHVGGETPTTREDESRLCQFEKQQQHRCHDMDG